MKKRPREPKPILPVLASATGPALIKHLASCSTKVRSQSLRLIHSWLASQSDELSESDIKRLWKGLFYCLWHADKTPNQVALIDRLTSLFLSLHPSTSLEFFRGFLLTLRREWPGIDKLRLDKFYLLIRRFVKALFELMRLRNWDADVLGEYFGVLERDGFLAEDKLQGNGVLYHVVSVFLEELKGIGFPVRMETVDAILRPFFAVTMKAEDKILLGKVKNCLFDELLKMGKELLAKKRMGVDYNENDGDTLLAVVALRMGMSGRLYQVGSSVDCLQGNRKVVLGLHTEFVKLEKDLESSGIEISIPEYSYVGGIDDDDRVTELVPIKTSEEAGVVGNEDQLDHKIFKKKSKVRKGMDDDDKKRKKKKKKKKKAVVEESSDLVMVNEPDNVQSPSGIENTLTNDLENNGIAESLNETMILNLQKQFEKVAAEIGSETDEDSDSCEISLFSEKSSRRKRKGADAQDSGYPNRSVTTDDGVDAAATSVDKSAKRVRFAMKNNLVWKPQNPLPPESLRLPPSATPRGSALKKGVAPGPVIEMPSLVKKTKQKKKKSQNRVQHATLAKKQQKRMQR